MKIAPWKRFISHNLSRRDIRLDALRGLMVMGMVLVNHPPPGVPVYPPLAHAKWHGWTLADVIFPGFLFAVGMSIRLAMADAHGLPGTADARLYRRIFWRFAWLQLLNVLLISFPYYFVDTLHFTGTLALIGWCYLIVALVHLHSNWRGQSILGCGLLLLQWSGYAFLPVDGANPGTLSTGANPAASLDRWLFVPLFGPAWATFDGLPVVLPLMGAVGTTLIGLLAGQVVSSARASGRVLAAMAGGGACLLALGALWSLVLPINKSLWTGSYVLLMAGIAMALFALLHRIVETGKRAWLSWLQVAGANALFFYVLAQCLQRVLVYGRMRTGDGTSIRLRQLLYERWFSGLPGEAGSLAYVLVFLGVCYAVAFVLHRNRIFLRV